MNHTCTLTVFHGAHQPLTLETTPVPAPGFGEILVRNRYVTLCRSDLTTFAGKRQEATPTILGHEVVGDIAAFGPGAPVRDCRGAELRPGDRVTWAIYAADPDTELARAGIPQKASGLFKYGHELLKPDRTLHGGLAEYCLLRRHTPLLRLDPAIPLPVAALINCSIATAAGSLRLAGDVKDRNVLVTGAGMLGVVACALCRSAGARQIIAADIDDSRLAVAQTFGADRTLNLRTLSPAPAGAFSDLLHGAPLHVGLDFSGVPETMEQMLAALGIGGTAVLVGATFPQRDLAVNAERMIRRLLTIKGLHNYNEADFRAAVEFIERNHARFPFAELVVDRFELNTVNEAFAEALQSGAYRVGIRIP